MSGWTLRLWLVLLGLVIATDASAQRRAESTWWFRAPEARFGHYWIKTDLPAERANELGRHLNIMHQEFSRRLASLPARAPARLNVMLFSKEIDYMETLQARFGVDATGTGGIFFAVPSGTALAVWMGEQPPQRVLHALRHEGFHQFAYSRFGGDLPIWVNEGLAELFGQSMVVRRRVLIGHPSHRAIASVRDSIELQTYVPFQEMLAMSSEQWRKALAEGTAKGLYDQAWSMVYFLVYGDDGRYVGRFERYLRIVNAGFPSETAFFRAFETKDIDAFEKRWRQFALTAEPSGLATALERIEFLAAGALVLSRSGVFPASLDELRVALREINFKYTLTSHAQALDVRADDAVFEIPRKGSGRIETRPVFVVFRPKLHQLTRRERQLEQDKPSPSVIKTMFLKAANIVVHWHRDPATDEFGYTIEIKPE